jgi:hypothetical protein
MRAMLRRLSLLELLHPDGVARRAHVIGSGCPKGLAPARLVPPEEGLDLVVLAPAAAELTRGWFEGATQSLAGTLDSHGVAYLLVPRNWRLRARRLLSRHGLAVEAFLAHLPDWATSRYLVPLASGPTSYALSSLIPVRSSRRRVAIATLAISGGPALVAHGISAAGLVVRRPGARPLFEWLFELGRSEPCGPAMVTAGADGNAGSFVLHRFSADGARPTAVAKLRASENPGTAPTAEAEILKRLAAGARAAGAETPEPLMVESRNGRSLLLETPVGGRSAAVILGDASRRLADLHERIAQWLQRWNRATAVVRPLHEAQLAEDVIAPAELLGPLVGEEYVSWLKARSADLVGTAMPFVATHNDLTMSNLFLADSGALAVVDWEAARDGGLPLVDFLYAAADAVAAVHRYDDRLRAFVDCFSEGGRHAGAVGLLNERLAQALELEPSLAELCFHACWVHHAANEQRSSRQGDPRPFLEILRWVAKRELDRSR